MGYADGPRYGFRSEASTGANHVWDMQEDRIVSTHTTSGEAYREITRLNREHLEQNCEMCRMIKNGGGFGPGHFASTLCRSGRHAHCTCDSCF